MQAEKSRAKDIQKRLKNQSITDFTSAESKTALLDDEPEVEAPKLVSQDSFTDSLYDDVATFIEEEAPKPIRTATKSIKRNLLQQASIIQYDMGSGGGGQEESYTALELREEYTKKRANFNKIHETIESLQKENVLLTKASSNVENIVSRLRDELEDGNKKLALLKKRRSRI